MFLKIGPMQENNEKEFLKCNLVAISLEHCVTVWGYIFTWCSF